MRVLIADDDPINRAILAEIVAGLGHETVVAVDGLEAWRIAAVGGIDVLLTDWLMPGLDGPDLCRRMRGEESGEYSYIVMITGLGRPEQILEGMSAGADDYLVKPVDAFTVRTHLIAAQRVIGLHRRLREVQERLEASNRALLELSLNDPLTGLGNRRRMEEDLERTHARALRAGRAYAVALLDVDYFKAYNDHYGHAEGDEVLRCFARCLASVTRTDECVFRYGGEEFLALFPDCASLEAASTAANRIRRAVAQAALPHAARPTSPEIVTVSCGVAWRGPEATWTSSELFALADAALYQAKSDGRNCVRTAAPQPLDVFELA